LNEERKITPILSCEVRVEKDDHMFVSFTKDDIVDASVGKEDGRVRYRTYSY
jgi:hypothetical protein